MPSTIFKNFDDRTGERLWSPDDPNVEIRKAFFEDLKQRAVAKTFFRDYDVTPENIEVILHIAESLYPGLAVFNVSQFEDILASGIAAGEFHRRPTPPAATAPETDKNGKTLTDAQKKWREYRQFAETASADERRARCQTDSGFRSFVETQRREEMRQEIDGAAPEVSVDRRKQTIELRQFVEIFRTSPRSALRPIDGIVKIGDKQWSWTEFQNLISEATSAGLL